MSERRMGDTGQQPPRFSTLAYLEQAALYPDRRSDALDQALKAIANDDAVVGTALLPTRMDEVAPWQVKYAGGRKKEMQRWLKSRLDAPLQERSYEEAARRLFVHANTIKYRIRRAKQILGRDPGVPEERIAMSLAAFIWLRLDAK